MLFLPVQLRHLVLELDNSIELGYLARLTHLESLRVNCHVEIRDRGEGSGLGSRDYLFLSSLTILERLELDNEPFDDLEVLLPLQKLRYLSVLGTLLDDVVPLLNLPSLEYVDLKDTPGMADVCSILRQHPRLRRLRHPNGYDMIAPFTSDDLAPPPPFPRMLSTSFDSLE